MPRKTAKVANTKSPMLKVVEPRHAPSVVVFNTNGASPNTKAVLASCVPRGTEMLSPSRIDMSPGQRHALTRTARKRPIRLNNQFTVGSTTSEVGVNVGEFSSAATPQAIRDVRSAVGTFGCDTIVLNSGLLTPADLRNMPAKRSCSQNAVMHNQKAGDVIMNFLQQRAPNTMSALTTAAPFGASHWCHILAFCLVAGKWDPQQTKNLLAGPARFNWSQKHYEVVLRKLLLEQAFQQMEITGTATFIRNTEVAHSINLDVTLLTDTNREFYVNLHFEAFNGYLESSVGSDVMSALLRTLSQTPSSPPPVAARQLF